MRQPYSICRRFGVQALLSALALVPMLGWGADAATNWLDIESRIQYGYYTEDLHSLRNLADPLAANPSHDRLKSYYQGLLEYRLTQLLQAEAEKASAAEGKAPGPPPKNDRSKNEPRQRVERCVGSLDQALEAQSHFADALALQSACLGLLAELSAWRAPLAAPKSANQIHKALQIAPKNPRVLLLEAIGDYERSKTPDADSARACGKFQAVTVAFETERAAVDSVPGWGAAEAYTWLGRCYLDAGDAVKARDALERALLIAPEFGQARRLLAAITSG
jgi:tetratricopeptide (TPR) repeat protein